MAALFTLSAAGLGFLALAAIETLGPLISPKPALPVIRHSAAAALSSLFILSSLVSALSPSPHDPIGYPLPLSTAAVASLFLLHSLAGFLSHRRPSLHLPPSLLSLLLLAAFIQELLLLSLRRTDQSGIENRYLDLLLAPALLCTLSTLASIAHPRSPAPRIALAAGLALHGTWFIQMAFSFFSTALAHGCWIHRTSRANYTIKCKGHQEYHRGRAIATLQFNCHLALAVVVGVALYSVVAGRNTTGYSPLNKELQSIDHDTSRFTLDSDEEEAAAEAGGTTQQRDVVLPIRETNGSNGSH